MFQRSIEHFHSYFFFQFNPDMLAKALHETENMYIHSLHTIQLYSFFPAPVEVIFITTLNTSFM